MTTPGSSESVGRDPEAERRLTGVIHGAYGQAQQDLATALALYRQNLAASGGDQVLVFGLVEAALMQDNLGEQRTLRALAAAVARLARLETEVTHRIGRRA